LEYTFNFRDNLGLFDTRLSFLVCKRLEQSDSLDLTQLASLSYSRAATGLNGVSCQLCHNDRCS